MKFSDTLRTYMAERGLSVHEFAESVNVTPAAVYLWLQGRRRPNAALAVRIDRATDGALSRASIRPEVFDQRPAA